MVFKLVISDPKRRKAYQKETEEGASGLIGKKIGEKVPGGFLGLEGYELEITGGSDREGFPMRPDVEGPGRKRVVLSYPPGFHPVRSGERKRKSVRGNTISKDISQINVKVVKEGKKELDYLLGAKEKQEGKTEKKPEEGARPEEKPKEEEKEETKPEEKPKEAPKEKKPGEAKKEKEVKPPEKERPKEEKRPEEKEKEAKEVEKPKEKKEEKK